MESKIEKQNQIQCYQNCSFPSSLFLLLSHEPHQQQNYKINDNPKFKIPPIPFPISCHEY
jgi:hypothetical protein